MRSALLLSLLVVMGCNQAEVASKAPKEGQKSLQATPVKTEAPPAQEPAKAATGPLVNEDGSIDKGLPKTAGQGAKLPKDGDPIAIFDTSMGRVVVKFFPEKAPKHVENFITLAKKGFYDGTKFHRVIPGFMIQGGDPNTKSSDHEGYGQGGPGYNVKQEFNDLKHVPGILSMARTNDPDGAGSQFFLMHKTSKFLDGKYTVFGQALEGVDIIDKIVNVDRDDRDCPLKDVVLKKVEITKWPVKLNGV